MAFRRFPGLRLSPPLLLFGNDIELIPLEKITKEIENLENPEDYPYKKEELKFIPFAQTAGGDLYCFYINGQKGEDIPIVIVWHDMDEAEILAKNLQDFIFRSMLEAVVDIYEDELIMEDNFEENISNMFNTHKKYLTENQNAIINEIYSREIEEYTYKLPGGNKETAEGLLTYNELEKILHDKIGFEGLNNTFPYRK